MDQVIEKDIKNLRQKNKKIKLVAKRTLIGVVSTLLAFSVFENTKHGIAINQARNDKFIEQTLTSELNKKQKVADVFAYAIRNNTNIPDYEKNKIIEAFTTNVIDYTGDFFTDENIINMYAVASTQKVKKMSNFSKEHGWWAGDYVSFTNTYFLDDRNKDYESILIAHEQLHAIMRSNILDTGFTNFLINGYGINEAATSTFSKDFSYYEMSMLFTTLGLIIGYDTLFKYYSEGDLNGLKMELNKYILPQETNHFIINFDLIVFSHYFRIFLENNGIAFDNEKFNKIMKDKTEDITLTLKKIYKNKFGVSCEESKFGNLIFNSLFFNNDVNDYAITLDSNFEGKEIKNGALSLDDIIYDITFYDANTIRIDILPKSFGHLFSFSCNKPLHECSDDEYNKILEEFGVNGIYSSIYSELNRTVKISSFYLFVNANEIENFDIDETLKDLNNRVINNVEKSHSNRR